MAEKKPVTLWLKVLSYILVPLFFILDYYSNIYPSMPYELKVMTFGGSIWVLIGGMIAIACGNKCSKWASEIKKSPNVAYVVGFIFALLGLLGYWIYYKTKSKK